ncbi:MAG TPA: ABC transporter substrate-binding protein, partial [Candidatus Binatia bacterium]|nr:ABC transporter substrate-binding protein [Candidatus Binatia bacterium]
MNKAVASSMLCAVMLVAISLGAEAQQTTKIPRIGYISGPGDASNPGPYVEALRQGLRELGYVEGKNFVIEYRGAGGKTERYSSLVDELLQLKVDVLVVPTLPAILTAKQATKTIPIVMVSNRDPVATGVVDSLARPGGNITGLATLSTDLSGKRLELLLEVVPKLMRVGILLAQSGQSTAISFKQYEAAAHALKLQLHTMEVDRQKPDLQAAFQPALKSGVSAIATITGSLLCR